MILTEKSSELKGMDNHLKKLLQDWFSGGFLQLKEISWEQSPASLIEYVRTDFR